MESCSSRKTVVIKLGGSVLVDANSYGQGARFIARRLHSSAEERFLVVVSAQEGFTNELEELARGITKHPNPRTLDLLWSTGELRSVALLTLHLEEMGVPAVGLNVHESGLRFNRSHVGRTAVECLSSQLRRAFDDHAVVIVPGFFATLANGTLVSLGRGGSDLSAVLLADALEADQCELVKDVSGYFTEDPRVRRAAEHLPWLSYQQALEMASAGCELVQVEAIEAARQAGLRLLVRSLDEMAPVSVVSESVRTGAAPDSLRTANHCEAHPED
jgi:aspartate kinase